MSPSNLLPLLRLPPFFPVNSASSAVSPDWRLLRQIHDVKWANPVTLIVSNGNGLPSLSPLLLLPLSSLWPLALISQRAVTKEGRKENRNAFVRVSSDATYRVCVHTSEEGRRERVGRLARMYMRTYGGGTLTRSGPVRIYCYYCHCHDRIEWGENGEWKRKEGGEKKACSSPLMHGKTRKEGKKEAMPCHAMPAIYSVLTFLPVIYRVPSRCTVSFPFPSFLITTWP